MPDFALGRLPADPTQPKLQLRRLAAAAPAPPARADWLSAVPRWGMYRNDQVGCCTVAAAGHTAVKVDKYGQNRDLNLTDEQILQAYAAISGWDGTDATDVGATLQAALNYWRATGVGGQKIAAFAWVKPTDLDAVRACIATFGSIYVGAWITSAAMNEVNQGKPWSYTGSSRLLGGHAVQIGAYDENGFTCVTWGKTQKMTTAWFQRYVDEVTVPIDLDWVRANGTSPAGFDIARLNNDFTALTGQPAPFPVPPPAPLSPDAELVAAFTKWRAAKKV